MCLVDVWRVNAWWFCVFLTFCRAHLVFDFIKLTFTAKKLAKFSLAFFRHYCLQLLSFVAFYLLKTWLKYVFSSIGNWRATLPWFIRQLLSRHNKIFCKYCFSVFRSLTSILDLPFLSFACFFCINFFFILGCNINIYFQTQRYFWVPQKNFYFSYKSTQL